MKYNFNESLSSLGLYEEYEKNNVLAVFDISNNKRYSKVNGDVVKFNPINKYEFIYRAKFSK